MLQYFGVNGLWDADFEDLELGAIIMWEGIPGLNARKQ